MSDQGTTPKTIEAKTVDAIYAGINGYNLDAVIEQLHPEIVRIEPSDFPTPGTYRGHDELRAHLNTGRSTWAEGACQPERYFQVGEKVVVFLHIHVRLKLRTEWIDARIADGFVVKNGKATQMISFLKREEALAWAGLNKNGEPQ